MWSPTNSQAAILAVISSAKHTLPVENEEMGDPIITSALEAAAKRGVNVKITMTAQSEWDSAFSALVKAGAHVRTYKDSTKVLYIHAKAVVADAGSSDEQMFVGSENFSAASLRRNRELGIRTTNKPVISAVAAVLAADYAGATPFRSMSRLPRAARSPLLMAGCNKYSVGMRAIRVVSAVAAGALVAAVAACTGSTATIIGKPGASGSAAPAGNAAGGLAAASAKPSPAGPVVTITPGNGAAAADPSQGITVTAAGGTLRNVAVATAGDPVTGSYSADRTPGTARGRWTSRSPTR